MDSQQGSPVAEGVETLFSVSGEPGSQRGVRSVQPGDRPPAPDFGTGEEEAEQ